jgi:mono/diheme cytochrome c family protein
MRGVLAAVLTSANLVLASAPRRATAAFDPEQARKPFEAKCSVCHPLDRPLRKNKGHAGWEKTVSRMKGYVSGQSNDADAHAIAEYLTRLRGPKN